MSQSHSAALPAEKERRGWVRVRMRREGGRREEERGGGGMKKI